MSRPPPAPLAVRLDNRNPLAVALERRAGIQAALDAAIRSGGFDIRQLRADLARIDTEIHQLRQ